MGEDLSGKDLNLNWQGRRPEIAARLMPGTQRSGSGRFGSEQANAANDKLQI